MANKKKSRKRRNVATPTNLSKEVLQNYGKLDYYQARSILDRLKKRRLINGKAYLSKHRRIKNLRSAPHKLHSFNKDQIRHSLGSDIQPREQSARDISKSPPDGGKISDARRRAICKQRSERRHVLFVQRKAGKGVPGPKIKRYTEKSKVKCK